MAGGLYRAKLASTCWTVSFGPLFTHAIAVTVTISITDAMKRSRIISAPPSMIPIQQQQRPTAGSSQGCSQSSHRWPDMHDLLPREKPSTLDHKLDWAPRGGRSRRQSFAFGRAGPDAHGCVRQLIDMPDTDHRIAAIKRPRRCPLTPAWPFMTARSAERP